VIGIGESPFPFPGGRDSGCRGNAFNEFMRAYHQGRQRLEYFRGILERYQPPDGIHLVLVSIFFSS
jgi:hypothetical protein